MGRGGRASGPLPGGLYIGSDSGAGWGTPQAGDLAPAFGARIGYEFPSGLGLDLRVDDHGGVPATDGAMAAAGGGIDYYAPFAVLRPFAEIHVGAADYEGRARVSDEIGAGLSMAVSDDVGLDAAFRDWALVDGQTFKTLPSVTLGVDIFLG